MTGPRRVLLLCTGNSCRSQMAEGPLRHLGADHYEAFTAGTEPEERVHPLAVEVMREGYHPVQPTGGRRNSPGRVAQPMVTARER